MNRALVAQKLLQIGQCLNELQPLCRLTYRAFAAEPAHFRVAERDVQLIVDSAVAVNNELIVSAGRTPPSTYYETFEALRILPAALARRLARTTGLRNRIVHQYESVDLRVLHKAIRGFVAAYTSYVRTIRRRTGV